MASSPTSQRGWVIHSSASAHNWSGRPFSSATTGPSTSTPVCGRCASTRDAPWGTLRRHGRQHLLSGGGATAAQQVPRRIGRPVDGPLVQTPALVHPHRLGDHLAAGQPRHPADVGGGVPRIGQLRTRPRRRTRRSPRPANVPSYAAPARANRREVPGTEGSPTARRPDALFPTVGPALRDDPWQRQVLAPHALNTGRMETCSTIASGEAYTASATASATDSGRRCSAAT